MFEKKSKSFIDKMLPAPRNGGFKMEGYWVWGGSVVKGEDNKFHIFASRWPKYLPMHPGWIVSSEIVRAVSDTPEGPYDFQEVVLPARGADYWDGRSTHNPHIIKWKDRYILYYMGSTHPFADVKEEENYGLDDPRCIVGRSNKRVGLAVADSVLGPWERLDHPILPTRPGKFDSFLTSNPAPCIHTDGSVLLVYKARAYKKPPYDKYLQGKMTIGVAFANNFNGSYKVLKDETIFPPDQIHIEDPFIWKTKDGYELIAKDMDGNSCGEKYAGVHVYSIDGINWKIYKNRKAYSRKIRWDDGSIQVMGNLERPFILFQEGVPTHMFFATADGSGGFSNAQNTWNMVIPLEKPQ